MLRFIKKSFRVVVLAGMCWIGQASLAQADILLNFVNVDMGGGQGGSNRFNYNVILSGGSELDALGHNGNEATGNLFTIYDIANFVGFGASPTLLAAGFDAGVIHAIGITPAFQTPPDDPDLPNITFTYHGANELENPDPINGLLLGSVFIDSMGVPDGSTLYYSAATQRNLPGQDDLLANNTSLVIGPGPVPEPASLALLGIGLPLVGGYLLRRRTKK